MSAGSLTSDIYTSLFFLCRGVLRDWAPDKMFCVDTMKAHEVWKEQNRKKVVNNTIEQMSNSIRLG